MPFVFALWLWSMCHWSVWSPVSVTSHHHRSDLWLHPLPQSTNHLVAAIFSQSQRKLFLMLFSHVKIPILYSTVVSYERQDFSREAWIRIWLNSNAKHKQLRPLLVERRRELGTWAEPAVRFQENNLAGSPASSLGFRGGTETQWGPVTDPSLQPRRSRVFGVLCPRHPVLWCFHRL